MVRTLTLECPHCGTVSELFLSSNPRIVIFNCPECWTPQLYFEHKIYELTEHQIEVLKNSSGPSSIGHLLSRIVQRKKHTAALLEARQGTIPTRERVVFDAASDTGPQRDGRVITVDDVTNLRIELAFCRDSRQFIEKI